MSASIVESKFQVLDRATKLLTAARHRGSKVSSQKLREIVEYERRRSAASGGKTSSSSSCSTHGTATQPSSHKRKSRNVREPVSASVEPFSATNMPVVGGVKERASDFDSGSRDVDTESYTEVMGTATRRTNELRCRTWDIRTVPSEFDWEVIKGTTTYLLACLVT